MIAPGQSRGCDEADPHELGKALGLLPFFAILTLSDALLVRSIAATVFLNGVACHICAAVARPDSRSALALKYWDVACNVVLVVAVTATASWQPWTALLASFSVLCWLCASSSRLSARAPKCETAIHVVCVQGSLAWCLACFHTRRSP